MPVNINNNNNTGSMQVMGDYATVIGSFSTSQLSEIQEIRKHIEENCTKQQADALLPVISELEKSAQLGMAEVKESKKWIDKLQSAILAIESAAVISNAQWWPVLVDKVHDFISRI